jgi:hypothetical protein
MLNKLDWPIWVGDALFIAPVMSAHGGKKRGSTRLVLLVRFGAARA